jgi:hypothetical protein
MSDEKKSESKPKRPYNAPKLLVHGDLLSLTRGGNPAAKNDMDGSSTGKFTGGSSTMSMN